MLLAGKYYSVLSTSTWKISDIYGEGKQRLWTLVLAPGWHQTIGLLKEGVRFRENQMFTFYILIRSVLFIANLHVLKLHITKQECRNTVFLNIK